MKIFIISSAAFYDKIKSTKDYLESKGFELLMPNTYDSPNLTKEAWNE